MAEITNNKKDTYYKCVKCGDKIYWNTRKKMISCECGAISVDGCEYYARIIGEKDDYKTIYK